MNPIIALWCVPRSRSTAMERLFFGREGLKILHEPFLYRYYVGEARRALPHFSPDPTHPTTFEGLRDLILGEARRSTVFFKDMSYYVADHLAAAPDFFLGLTNSFLVRDPAETLLSYHKIDPEVTLEELGHEALCKHALFVADKTGKPPVVIESGDLVADPEGILRAYCRAIDMPFDAEALDWSGAPPKEWQAFAGWHKDVASSSGIAKGSGPSEAERRLLESDDRLRGYVEHHRPFYEKLLEFRLAPLHS